MGLRSCPASVALVHKRLMRCPTALLLDRAAADLECNRRTSWGTWALPLVRIRRGFKGQPRDEEMLWRFISSAYVLMCGSACSLHLYHIVYKHLPAPMTYMGDYGELDKPPSADL